MGLCYDFFLVVPFPPIGVQLDLMFVDGDFSITAAWMVSCNRTDNFVFYVISTCINVCVYAYMYIHTCMHKNFEEGNL